MKILQKIILGAGILFLAGGVVGAGLIYRDIRTENLIHAKMAMIRIPFSDTSSSASGGFLPFREGLYTLYLSPSGPDIPPGSDPGRCATGAVLDGLMNYDGAVDVIITDPEERVRINRSISGEKFPSSSPGDNGWIFIDTIRITPGETQWTLGVYVCPADSSPPACEMNLFLLPPQRYDIGAYVADGITRVVGFAGLMLTGFIMIVLAGRIRR